MKTSQFLSALAVFGAAQAAPTTTSSTATALRILPLGDSITWGIHSNPNKSLQNGYRLTLRNTLISSPSNFTVNMIGAQESGTFADDQHGGYGGYLINEILTEAHNVSNAPAKPNVVLVHAGTNDMVQDKQCNQTCRDNAPTRLSNLIRYILSESVDAVVLVAQMIPNLNATHDARIVKYNKQVPAVVDTFAGQGSRVAVLDMYDALVKGEPDFTNDETHPAPEGYDKMAAVWAEGIEDAFAKGWISSPA